MTDLEASQIVDAYVAMLPRMDNAIADESALPFSKDCIKAAIRFLFESAAPGHPRVLLRDAYLRLAHFHAGVGIYGRNSLKELPRCEAAVITAHPEHPQRSDSGPALGLRPSMFVARLRREHLNIPVQLQCVVAYYRYPYW